MEKEQMKKDVINAFKKKLSECSTNEIKIDEPKAPMYGGYTIINIDKFFLEQIFNSNWLISYKSIQYDLTHEEWRELYNLVKKRKSTQKSEEYKEIKNYLNEIGKCKLISKEDKEHLIEKGMLDLVIKYNHLFEE